MGTVCTVLMWLALYQVAVAVHELGHLWAARRYGVRVERFFILLDPGGRALFRRRVGETLWGVGWLPLGGYIKLGGMDRWQSGDHELHPTLDNEVQGCRPRQRYVLFGAGIAVNALLAAVLYCFAGYSTMVEHFAQVNLFMALWNFLPLPGFDGEHLANELLGPA